MKKLILFSLCVFFSLTLLAAESRSNEFLKFVAKSQGLRQFGLYLVMEERCYRYLPKPQAKECGRSSLHTLSILDFDLIMDETKKEDVDSFVFVAFRKEFVSLLNEARTTAYLNHINQVLNRFLSHHDAPGANLWDESVKFYGSEKLAARALAILFQDTSIRKLHLGWLHKKNITGNLSFTENVHTLDRVIDTINFIMDTTDENFRTLFYPKSALNLLNRNIYHFYVPLYLAQSLEAQGMKKDIAIQGPLMMTLSYEFITSASDLRYLFKDPAVVSAGSLQDIFGGYTGGRFGAGIFLQSSRAMNEAFKVSTKNGVDFLLR